MTKPDELLNVVIVAVIAISALLILVGSVLVYDKYVIYKLNKNVKEEESKIAKEANKTGNEK